MWRKSLFGWHLVTSRTVVSAQLVIQQRLSAHRSRTASLKVSGGQCRTSPGGGISMERGGWSGLLLTKPGTELRSLAMWRWALGSEPGRGGSRVCKNHLLGCLSCAGPWLWRQCYPSGCASLTGVTLRRGERTIVAGNRIEKVPAPSPPPPLTFWSTRHQTP